MKHVNILLCARELEFEKEMVRVIDTRTNEYAIPYEEIVMVNIVSHEEEGGYVPELEDVVSDMRGTLVICNRQQNFFEIETDAAGRTGGEVFIELTKYAPHALFGSQPWINQYDSRQFKEVLEMVDIMRECTSQS